MPASDVQISVVVATQSGPGVRVVEQGERREGRQVDAVVEDQLGLQPAVGHEQRVAGRLGRAVSRRPAAAVSMVVMVVS